MQGSVYSGSGALSPHTLQLIINSWDQKFKNSWKIAPQLIFSDDKWGVGGCSGQDRWITKIPMAVNLQLKTDTGYYF